MTVAEIMKEVVKDKPFFITSGGGLTLSGGEPLMTIGFASELLQMAKQNQLHSLVETCGLFSFAAFREQIAPYCDQIYFDLKLFDNDSHLQFCGVSNRRILDNLAELSQMTEAKALNLLPRVPLIPGITDTPENLTGIAGLLKQNRLSRVQLLHYNPLWFDKCTKIGKTSMVADDRALHSWLGVDHIKTCNSFFTNHGIEVV
jgi:pyruvate formate lyase activating enzyme